MINYNQDRNENALVEIRPEIIFEAFDDDGEVGRFQNETIRPIIKFQHNILLDYLLSQPKIDSVTKHKEVRRIFESKLLDFMNQSHVKWSMIGMVTGHFTREEMKFYLSHSKDLNKRIKHILFQRFIDSI